MTAPMQPDPLDALLTLAEAATPGPRKAFVDGVVGFDGILGGGFIPTPISDQDKHQRAADAAFVAALDPATVVGLIERVREADAQPRIVDAYGPCVCGHKWEQHGDELVDPCHVCGCAAFTLAARSHR